MPDWLKMFWVRQTTPRATIDMAYHLPVMPEESLRALAVKPDGVYVDATFGGGGHSRLILEQLGSNGYLLAFDQDEDARINAPADERFQLVEHNFRHLKRFLRLYGRPALDGILADLGVSSHQLDEAGRGFSYRFGEKTLDMRMDRRSGPTAAEVLNTYPVDRLQELLSRYGEVRNARTLAQAIGQARSSRPFREVSSLLEVVSPLIRGQRNRYLSQVFQALRIEVNDEMGALTEFLEQAWEVLRPGGRLVVITYHSVEDRLVKHMMRTGHPQGELQRDFYGNIFRPYKILYKKPLEPGADELERNTRARSAKLRAGEKLQRHGET